ncbi:hypothetical protein C8R43DRAFT_1132356 [Mycena crocata]|nr:hypothetical protein C8R43DRAFT_1132356 [Mycena crocata]
MSTPFLRHYIDAGPASLGFGKYMQDFEPTRDCSIGEGSLFTFKSIQATRLLETSPTSSRRGFVKTYRTSAFGEVDAVLLKGDKRSICLRLKCPSDASCVAREAYNAQLSVLQSVIDMDSLSTDSDVHGTWFCSTTMNADQLLRQGCFHIQIAPRSEDHYDYVLATAAVGRIIEVYVSLQRIDLPGEKDHNDRREYTLLGHQIIHMLPHEISFRGRAYVCDVGPRSLVVRSRTTLSSSVMSYSALYSHHRVHATTVFPEIDFTRNHPLSASQRAKVVGLTRLPYGPKWRTFLSTLDIVTLFKFSLQSCDIFEIVMEFVIANQEDLGRPGDLLAAGQSDSVAGAPVKVFPLIFSDLTLRDVLHLSWTSSKHHSIFGTEFQAALAALVTSFGLSYPQIRFMQTATLTVISGSTMSHLLDADIQPNNLDFYCPKPAYPWVGRFFEIASRYRPARTVDHCDLFEGISECLQWRRPDIHRLVNVFCSDSDSALECMTYFPFSHLMAAATHYGVWLAYPTSSTKKISMPNRDLVEVADPGNRQCLERLIKKYLSRNYSFAFHLASRHVCGTARECPVTVRTTIDDGCLQLFFPSHPFGAPVAPAHVYPADRAVSWSLNGASCPTGEQALSGAVRPRAHTRYVWWRVSLERLIAECNGERASDFDAGRAQIWDSWIRDTPVLLSCAPMSLTLTQRFAADPASFMAGTIYGDHCLPTRDASFLSGSLFTFKDLDPTTESPPVLAEPGFVALYIGEVFGHLKGVRKLGDPGPTIATLCAPEGTTCCVAHIFGMQRDALRTILDLDSTSADGHVTASWFSFELSDSDFPASPGVIYVHIHADDWTEYLRIGQNVAIKVYMKRVDFEYGNLVLQFSGHRHCVVIPDAIASHRPPVSV